MMFALVMEVETREKLCQLLLDFCKEIPQETSEIYCHNDFYGNASVIKSYCGYPLDKPLLGVLPHGIYPQLVPDIDLSFPLNYAFLPNDLFTEEFEQEGKKKVRLIGSPFLYADRMLSKLSTKIAKRGTIVFPAHSTHHSTVSFNIDDFLGFLHSLPDRFKPITVCLYWRDIQLGRHNKYLENGFRCTTAGHIYNKSFLYNIHKIISQSFYTITNDIGGHCYLSNFLGNPVYYFASEVTDITSLDFEQRCINSQYLGIFEEYKHISKDLSFSNFARQSVLTRKILGIDYFKEPQTMLRTLFSAI